MRHLAGVTQTPILRSDGTVVTAPGYDTESRLFYESPDTVSAPPPHPTKTDALAACQRLEDVFQDFPFAAREHISVLLSFILTPLARHLIEGPVPLFLVDSNVRGSGKSLICDLVSTIATGAEMPRMTNPNDDEEFRKRITALALGGDLICLIDNVAGRLGSPVLDAAITSTTWKDRILSRSEVVTLHLPLVWCATGNNVVLIGDTVRRVLHIRLECADENPEERTGFQYPDIRNHVKENRAQLVCDALTVLSAFIQAGQPQQEFRPIGSFEAWSRLIQSVIVWLDRPDPALTRLELSESADRELAAYRELLEHWSVVDPDGQGIRTSELLHLLENASESAEFHGIRDALSELCQTGAGLPNPRQLGSAFGKLRNRVCAGKCLTFREAGGRRKYWYVETRAK